MADREESNDAVSNGAVVNGTVLETVHGMSGEYVADRLRDDILAGEFVPGARIRQVDLAERYGATRAPVREALRMLARDGLITHVANAGARVAKLSFEECDELYRVREQLEPVLLEYTVPAITAEQLEQLRDLANRMEQSHDVEEFMRLDREFHELTYQPESTVMLAATVQGLWDRTHHYRRAFARLVRSDGDDAADHDHHLLVGAIARGDVTEAGAIIRMHIRRTRIQLGDYPEIFE